MASQASQILRSSLMIAGASVVNVAIGVVRTKIAALLLGPVGIGLIGILQSLMATGAAVCGLGISNAGVRQLALFEDRAPRAAARRALLWGSSGLAAIALCLFILLRVPLAREVIGDAELAVNVAWVGLGVAFTILMNSQVALLNGLRRIGELARFTIYSALLGTALGIAALVWFGAGGINAYVVAGPLAGVIIGLVILRKLPRPTIQSHVREIWDQLVSGLRLGSQLMVGGLVVPISLLIVRSLVLKELGPVSLGHFTAAWSISMMYIGFVLNSMATEYYPRLTQTISDRPQTVSVVNQQIELALVLSAPMLLAMAAGAPWVLKLLYSSDFEAAADLLRWQIIGDALKIVSWPLGFVLIAAGRGKTFLLTEIAFGAVLVAFIWMAVQSLGLTGIGVGYALMYAVYLPAVYSIARSLFEFRWTARVLWTGASVTAAVVTTSAAGLLSDVSGLLLGGALASASGAYAIWRLRQLGFVLPALGERWQKLSKKR